MSPIPLNKKKFSIESTDQKEYSNEKGFLRTRAFKLGAAKDYPGVDSSSCFESLHELCNIQIEELKKSLRQMTNNNDLLS